MSKFYKHDVREFVSYINSEEEALETLDYLYDILQDEAKERENCVNIMLYILEQFPATKRIYYYKNYEYFNKDKFVKRNYKYIPKPAPIIVEEESETIPEIDYNDHFAGLYFVGSSFRNPITNKLYFTVKVGEAGDIGARIKQYLGHNAGIYYNHSYFPVADTFTRKAMEKVCHQYLRQFAIGNTQNTVETFQVPECVYLSLCKQFENIETFGMIAKGELI